MVRDALVVSVAWTAPLVRFHKIQLSIVPTLMDDIVGDKVSNSHRILEAEKYGSMGNPVFCLISAATSRSV